MNAWKRRTPADIAELYARAARSREAQPTPTSPDHPAESPGEHERFFRLIASPDGAGR